MNRDIDAVEAGQEAANSLFPALKAANKARADETEKLLWWTGFLSAIQAYAAGSIGQEAVKEINEMSAGVTSRVIKDQAH